MGEPYSEFRMHEQKPRRIVKDALRGFFDTTVAENVFSKVAV